MAHVLQLLEPEIIQGCVAEFHISTAKSSGGRRGRNIPQIAGEFSFVQSEVENPRPTEGISQKRQHRFPVVLEPIFHLK